MLDKSCRADISPQHPKLFENSVSAQRAATAANMIAIKVQLIMEGNSLCLLKMTGDQGFLKYF
ncbi:MAG: hypothetical protein MUC50_14220 [Myxococcota bacterium]|nr:hypothetical protein [Myxococcota bacterium]